MNENEKNERTYLPLFASAAAVPVAKTRMLCPDLRVPSNPRLNEPGTLLAAEVTIMFFDSVCKNLFLHVQEAVDVVCTTARVAALAMLPTTNIVD